MASTGVRAEYPGPRDTPPAPEQAGWRRFLTPLAFLAPAIFFLAVWVIYPTISTAKRSLYSNRDSGDFVGIDNYERMFTEDVIFTAIKNNALWALVVPVAVTAVGLILAVLAERIRWATALKIALFIPLAVSLFAVGVIWRIMYERDPDRGAVNALISAVRGPFVDEGVLSGAAPSTDDLEGTPARGLFLKEPVEPGGVALLGLTAIRATEVPDDAAQAVEPEGEAGAIVGAVWRDFKPGGGTAGELETEEVGVAGATIVLRDANGDTVATTTSDDDGTFRFEELDDGQYVVGIGNKTFVEPFQGPNWLGESLITPALWISYIWVTAGFAMVIIGAGLAAIPRDVMEAARTDGASELQVFRRVTVPLLAPVLIVVFVTQIIGVLKVFDLVVAVAPGSSQDDATVLAFEMWRRSFSGQNLFGLGAAIATFLLLLFVPFLISQVRRFKVEAT